MKKLNGAISTKIQGIRLEDVSSGLNGQNFEKKIFHREMADFRFCNYDFHLEIQYKIARLYHIYSAKTHTKFTV